MDKREDFSRLKNTANIIQNMLTIVMAIAFTTAIIEYLTDGGGAPIAFENLTYVSTLAFLVVITTIIRFFHGNLNYMSSIYNISDPIAQAKKFDIRLAVDFIFLFIQAFIFCWLAIIQSLTYQFYCLFVILLFVDALWFFFIYSFSSLKQGEGMDLEESPAIRWMVTNFITGIILFTLLTSWTISIEDKVPFLFLIIMINAMIDYGLNWKSLYFPTSRRKNQFCAFVGARFTTAVDQNRIFNQELKNKINATHEVLQNLGLDVLSAHKKEDFGRNRVEPKDFVQRDIKDIIDADIYVLLVDEELSGGAFIELGWVSLLDKPIVILIPENFDLQNTIPMLNGLHHGLQMESHFEIINYTDLDHLKEQLRGTVREIMRMGK